MRGGERVGGERRRGKERGDEGRGGEGRRERGHSKGYQELLLNSNAANAFIFDILLSCGIDEHYCN